MIKKDKILHLIAGILIILACLLFKLPYLWSIVILFLVAAGKEVYDSFYPQKHTVDVYDALATFLGGLFILVIVEVLRYVG